MGRIRISHVLTVCLLLSHSIDSCLMSSGAAGGAIHKEIFEFKRVERGQYKGKEWESIVQPVIEKWGAFVEAYV